MSFRVRKKTIFTESALANNRAYGYYFRYLTELAISMFEWHNLPDSVDPRFMELILYNDGQVVFFEDDVMGYLCLQNITNGRLNVYRVPIGRRAYAVNGYQKNLTEDNSVIIYNNYLRTGTARDIERFAKRLWNLDQIIDVNANAQKTPVLVQGTMAQRLTLLNLYKEFDGNAPVIFGDKNLDINALKVLKTDAPYVADKLYQLKTQVWNEALTFLGISNLNIQKKERLVSDEVTRNMGGTIASRYSRLNARKEACEKINDMFGLDIDVNYREDYREADDEVMFAGATGDVNNPAHDMAIDIRTK